MNTSKKRPLLIVFFLMILPIWGNTQYNTGLVFNDPSGVFSLQLGPGWTQIPTPAGGEARQGRQAQGELGHYAYVHNGIAAAELIIASEPLPMALTAMQYAQAVEQNALRSLPQYQKLQERGVNLGGQEAYYYQFSILRQTQVGQTQVMTEQYFLVTQNTGYMITFMVLPNQFNTLKPILDQVIQSLQYGTRPVANVPQPPIMTQQTPLPYTQGPTTQTNFMQTNPYGQQGTNTLYPQGYPQTQTDLNALYQQYQQQQQQMMQQYMQMYGQNAGLNNPYGSSSSNPYGMPNTTDFFNQMMAQQAQMATLTPPPLTLPPQAQMLMNPQTIPTYPMANQTGQAQSGTTLTNPMQTTPQNIASTSNVYGTMSVTSQPPVAPTTLGPTLNSYQDPQNRFAILIPQNYQPSTLLGGMSFFDPSGQGIMITAVEVSGSAKEFLETSLKDKQILERKDVQVEAGINKIPGHWVRYQSSHGETGKRFTVTAMIVPERNLHFSFTVPEDQFEQNKETVEQVLNSVDVHER